MTINCTSPAAEAAVITLGGRVTIQQKPEQIVDTVEELLATGKKIIIFDLAGVMTIDSTGLGQFIVSHSKILAAGGKMSIAGVTDRIMCVFRVTKLDTVFEIHGSVAEGV
jgi:anti-sigma B factor antagonist